MPSPITLTIVLVIFKIAGAAIVYDPIGQLSVYQKYTGCLSSDDYAADLFENNKVFYIN